MVYEGHYPGEALSDTAIARVQYSLGLRDSHT